MLIAADPDGCVSLREPSETPENYPQGRTPSGIVCLPLLEIVHGAGRLSADHHGKDSTPESTCRGPAESGTPEVVEDVSAFEETHEGVHKTSTRPAWKSGSTINSSLTIGSNGYTENVFHFDGNADDDRIAYTERNTK